MKTFRLLLGGDEFDAGRYDDFPYADRPLSGPWSDGETVNSDLEIAVKRLSVCDPCVFPFFRGMSAARYCSGDSHVPEPEVHEVLGVC